MGQQHLSVSRRHEGKTSDGREICRAGGKRASLTIASGAVFAVPVPPAVAAGAPSAGYPLPCSVYQWLRDDLVST
jgi:hypothetical protein